MLKHRPSGLIAKLSMVLYLEGMEQYTCDFLAKATEKRFGTMQLERSSSQVNGLFLPYYLIIQGHNKCCITRSVPNNLHDTRLLALDLQKLEVL